MLLARGTTTIEVFSSSSFSSSSLISQTLVVSSFFISNGASTVFSGSLMIGTTRFIEGFCSFCMNNDVVAIWRSASIPSLSILLLLLLCVMGYFGVLLGPLAIDTRLDSPRNNEVV